MNFYGPNLPMNRRLRTYIQKLEYSAKSAIKIRKNKIIEEYLKEVNHIIYSHIVIANIWQTRTNNSHKTI